MKTFTLEVFGFIRCDSEEKKVVLCWLFCAVVYTHSHKGCDDRFWLEEGVLSAR